MAYIICSFNIFIHIYILSINDPEDVGSPLVCSLLTKHRTTGLNAGEALLLQGVW